MGGQLASDFVDVARPLGQTVFCKGLSRAELDVTDPFAVKDTVAEWCRVVRSDSPDHRVVVVNAAAYTAVDAAEDDEDTAYAVNATAPALLAQACAANGAKLVHVSTDYVFPGDRVDGPPYDVDDEPGPKGRTGGPSWPGSWRCGSCCRTPPGWSAPPGSTASRARTSSRRWLGWRPSGRPSPSSRTSTARRRGAETWLAPVGTGREDAPSGTYHCTGGGQTTWHGFAQAVFEELGADPARVQPISTDAYPVPAPRPAYSVLSPRAWEEAGLPRMPAWRDALAEAFRLYGSAFRP
jgi:dTDP-4-dehydrorhamnose reductase